MCGVIVVYAGRNWSTNLGRDAYVMIIASMSSWVFEATVIFSPTVCYFSREKPLVKSTAPGSSSSYICLRYTFPLHFYSDLLNQKYKNTLLRFISFAIYYFNLLQFISRPLANFWRRYSKGIDNPFNTSGCEVLLFVCKCCLRCVAWSSYWFDTLVS